MLATGYMARGLGSGTQDEVERMFSATPDTIWLNRSGTVVRVNHSSPRGPASRDLTRAEPLAAVAPDQRILLHAKIELTVFRSANASTRSEQGDLTLVLSD